MLHIITTLAVALSVICGKVTDGKTGLAGVQVSDGVNVTVTDKKGQYTLPASSERFVFISTPAGYKSSSFPGKTCFYQETGKGGRHDFTVEKRAHSDLRHKFVAIADPQLSDQDDLVPLVKHAKDLKQTADGFREEGVEYFGIILGDMVGWDHSLYPRINKILGEAGIDFRYTIGNHDMTNYGRSFETSTTDYENMYGPSYYSFNVGEVHYVMLNDNFFIGRDWYYIGYLPEKQLSWLEKDLAGLKKGSEVVVCMHIQSTLGKEDRETFSYGRIADDLANKKGLYAILEPYNATILSGHMHTNTNSIVTEHLREHNLGSMCGGWWCGDVCIDGSPAGYKVYERNGRELKWYYKGTGIPENCQMKIYADDPMYPGEIIAHVWDKDDNWSVELWADGAKVCDMQNFSGVDPHAYDQFKDPSIYKISWVTYFPTPNLYRAAIPCGASEPEVRVTNCFGETFTQTIGQ